MIEANVAIDSKTDPTLIDTYVALKQDEVAYAESKERQFMLYYDV